MMPSSRIPSSPPTSPPEDSRADSSSAAEETSSPPTTLKAADERGDSAGCPRRDLIQFHWATLQAYTVSMRPILSRWRWLVTILLSAGLTSILYNIFPTEPRWQLEIEGEAPPRLNWENAPRVTWDTQRQQARVQGPRSLIVLDSGTGQLVQSFPISGWGWSRFQFSPDGRYGARMLLLSTLLSTKFQWIDFEQGAISVRQAKGKIRRLRFSPGGDYLAVVQESPSTLTVLRTDSLRTVFESEYARWELSNHTSVFASASTIFVPDKQGLWRLGTRIWDLKTNQEVQHIQDFSFPLVWSPDGTRIVSKKGIGIVGLWDIVDPSAPKLLATPPIGPFSYPGEFSPNSRWWAAEAQNGIEIWNARTGTKVYEFKGKMWDGPMFSPDSRYLALVSSHPDSSDTFHLVELESGSILWERPCQRVENVPLPDDFPKAPSPSFSFDSRFVVLATKEYAFEVVSTATGKVLQDIGTFGAKPDGISSYTPTQRSVNDRFLLVDSSIGRAVQRRSRPRPWPKSWFEQLLNIKNDQDIKPMSVLDLPASSEVLYLEIPYSASADLAPDGASVLLVESREDRLLRLTCWDVPASHPWRWILGIPLALLALIFTLPISARWLLRRLRRKAQVANPTALSG